MPLMLSLGGKLLATMLTGVNLDSRVSGKLQPHT